MRTLPQEACICASVTPGFILQAHGWIMLGGLMVVTLLVACLAFLPPTIYKDDP